MGMLLMQEKVLEEQDRVRRTEEKVKQQQQQQQQRARAKQEAALAKASLESSKRRKGPSPPAPHVAVAPAAPAKQDTAVPQDAAATMPAPVSGKLIEMTEQPSTAAASTTSQTATAEAPPARMGMARSAVEATPIATPSPPPAQRLFQFGAKSGKTNPSQRSTASPVPILTQSAGNTAAVERPLQRMEADWGADVQTATIQQGAAVQSAITQPGADAVMLHEETSDTLPVLTSSSRVSAADAALSHAEASMALPLLTGSRPAVGADVAVRHGGIRSSTASPLPNGLSRSASPSLKVGQGFATGSITASPVLRQVTRQAGLGRSLRTGQTVAQQSRAPSVLAQSNVQAAVKHLLQRLPAESSVA